MHHNVPLARQPLYGYDLYRWIVRYALDAAWDEGKHSRDAQGRFTDGLSNWRDVRNAALNTLRQQYPTGHPPVPAKTKNGDTVLVSYAGLKHALHKGMPKPEKVLLSLHLKALLSQAIKTGTFPDKHGRADPNSVTHYSTDAQIDDALFEVDIVVRNHHDGSRYYDHFVMREKAHQGYPESGTLANSPARPFSGLRLSMNQLRQAVK